MERALRSRTPPSTPAVVGCARNTLLDAAERVFVQRGVEAADLGDVAAEAGIALPIAIAEFDDKAALLGALRERFVATFCERLREAMDRCRPEDWTGRLRAWVSTGFNGYLDSVALHDVVFHGLPHDRQAHQDNCAIDQLTELLEGGVAARAWVTNDPRMTATIFFNALHAAVDRLVVTGEPYDRARPLRTLIGYFERSVQWWRPC